MRLGEARTASRWGPSPLLLPQPCQPRAPGLASSARATWAGEPLLPAPEIPPHSHSLTSWVLCTCRDSIHRRNSWAEVVRTHVCTYMHTQGLELPASIPPELNTKMQGKRTMRAAKPLELLYRFVCPWTGLTPMAPVRSTPVPIKTLPTSRPTSNIASSKKPFLLPSQGGMSPSLCP